MSLVDRFVCRREGHKPTAVLTGAQPFITSYVTSCVRCGKFFELPGSPAPEPPRPAPPPTTEYRGG